MRYRDSGLVHWLITGLEIFIFLSSNPYYNSGRLLAHCSHWVNYFYAR